MGSKKCFGGSEEDRKCQSVRKANLIVKMSGITDE